MMRGFLLLILIVFFAGVVQAHQQKESYTTVTYNERTERLEVMHRFYIHDAEHALNTVNGSKADIIQNKESQATFAEYVKLSFGLKDEKKNTLIMEFVGFEVEGKYLWVYQESQVKPPFKSFWVKMSTLQDIWEQQINQVNFEISNSVKAVRLKSDDGWVQVL